MRVESKIRAKKFDFSKRSILAYGPRTNLRTVFGRARVKVMKSLVSLPPCPAVSATLAIVVPKFRR